MLRKYASDPLWKALTYDSGPYEITKLRPVMVELAQEFERIVRGEGAV